MTSTAELACSFLGDDPQGASEAPRGRTLAEAVADLLDRLNAGRPIIDVLPTGLTLLDSTAGGLVRGEYLGLVAAPGLGKSTLADQLVVSTLCQNHGTTGIIFNLETSTPIRLARLICGRSVEIGPQNQIGRCVPLGPMLRGELAEGARDHARAVAAGLAEALGDRLRFVDDQYIAGAIAGVVLDLRPDVVLVDHCGLLDVSGSTGSLVERFDESLHRVVAAIREVNAAGVFISELSKAALTAGATDIGAVRGSARFASLAGQLITLRLADDGQTDPLLTAELRKNRHGRAHVQQSARFFGGLGYLSWRPGVEPIPRPAGRGADRDG